MINSVCLISFLVLSTAMAKFSFSEILSIIKPSKQELAKEYAFANEVVKYIDRKTPKNCDVILTGSVAKKTFLRDKRDIDIFVLFGLSFPKDQLESTIKKIMKSAFPELGYQLSYAEHPYARFHYEGRQIDLVPAYKISDASEKLSAVDRSVLHTKYVKKNLKEKQRDDVLLLKQFLRANSLYGAEIRIQGFPGYLCELLIIKYGTFSKLARAASKWDDKVFIDLKKFYKKKEISSALDYFSSSFVVVDPTDKKRNVAAAVSKDNFKKFISLCKRFVKKPSATSFLKKPETFDQKVAKAKKGKKVFLISMPRPFVVDDVLWGQLHKLIRQLKIHLKDYTPKKILGDDTRHLVRLAIILEKDKLPSKMLLEGPPLKMKEHIAKFKKSHKRAKFVKKKGKIYAEIKRPVTSAEKSIKNFFKEFSKGNSHLAHQEEMIVIERMR